MHRSGTSLCANILHALGVDMAESAGASPDNQRGHWERARINDLHDAVLALFNRGWAEPTHHLPLPDGWWNDPRVPPIAAEIAQHLSVGLARTERFGFKDPRTSRLLAMWPPLFAALDADPLYIFCVRDPAQVARSLAARDRMEGEEGAHRWLVYNAQAVVGVATARVCVINYEHWFTRPEATLDRLARFVGVAPRADALRVIDADLRHDALGAADPVPEVAARLHAFISEAGEHFDARLLDLADTILGCEAAVMPFLRDAALMRLSINEQNRVILDLQNLVETLRKEDVLF
jgi:hypothetical protein